MRQYFLLSFISLVLASCASITADSNQVISVTTTPAGASCALSNGEGSWSIASTPGNANVKRAFSPLLIRCEKHGYTPAQQTLEAETRGRAYGNILLLGIPAVVDAATGDGYVYDPASVNLALQAGATKK